MCKAINIFKQEDITFHKTRVIIGIISAFISSSWMVSPAKFTFLADNGNMGIT